MINRQTYRDHVIEHVCHLLRSGSLQPGDKVLESRLASELGVSRAPVREAVRHLVGEGLLDYRPQVGSFVACLSPQQIIDSYVTRGLLEGFAIAEARNRYDTDSRTELEQLCHQMRNSAVGGDDASLIEAGATFHRRLYGRSTNDQLLENIEQLSNKLHLLFYRHWASLYTAEEIEARHLQLLDLVFEGEPWNIEQGFRQHYIDTGRKVAALYPSSEEQL